MSSFLATMYRAQADSQPTTQTAAPSAEELPTKAVEAIATHVVDQAALAEQADRLWAPRAATEDDPLAVLGQAGDGAAENYGWADIVAKVPVVAGAVKVEIAPPTPQAAIDVTFLK
jgi:hypothetical protein